MFINIYDLLCHPQKSGDLALGLAVEIKPDNFFLTFGKGVIDVPLEFSSKLVNVPGKHFLAALGMIGRLLIGK